MNALYVLSAGDAMDTVVSVSGSHPSVVYFHAPHTLGLADILLPSESGYVYHPSTPSVARHTKQGSLYLVCIDHLPYTHR